MFRPGTFPDTKPVSPPKAGMTPKLVRVEKFSLPSYKRFSPWVVFVDAPTPRAYKITFDVSKLYSNGSDSYPTNWV